MIRTAPYVRTPTELITHADGSTTIQAADPNTGCNALREREEYRAAARRAALERELRLDEERIADQMTAAELRGITAPDY